MTMLSDLVVCFCIIFLSPKSPAPAFVLSTASILHGKIRELRDVLAWQDSNEGSPTKIDYRTKGTLILTSLLEDLVVLGNPCLVVLKANQGKPHFRVP